MNEDGFVIAIAIFIWIFCVFGMGWDDTISAEYFHEAERICEPNEGLRSVERTGALGETTKARCKNGGLFTVFVSEGQ